LGPKKFEGEFKKRMQGLFNETKVFFFHDKDTTKVAYIDGNKLKYVELFRSDCDLDLWCNYFAEYLQTGVFDENAYWRVYSNTKEEDWLSDVTPIKMKCVNQIWSAHSPEFNKFIRETRNKPGWNGVGFKQVQKQFERLTCKK
jgi:hypothetical protein